MLSGPTSLKHPSLHGRLSPNQTGEDLQLHVMIIWDDEDMFSCNLNTTSCGLVAFVIFQCCMDF